MKKINTGMFILILATFVSGTVELVVAGMLDMISKNLNVSIGTVGQLITIFALVFAFGGPILMALTSKIERRKLLIVSMLIFLFGNILSAVSINFTMLLIARIIVASSCSIIVVVSITMAANTVSEELRGRAIGFVFMGLSASLVFGVPLGTIIGENFGWRMTFVLISILSIITILGMIKFLPKVQPQPTVPLRKLIESLKNKKIIAIQLISFLELTGHFIVYTYLTPLLQQTMGLSINIISIILFIFGSAGIFGGWIGGWASDKFGGAKTVLVGLIVLGLSLVALPYSTYSIYTLIITIVVYGASVWALSPAVQNYLVSSSTNCADIQIGLNTSFLYLGVALGSGVGGVLINNYSAITNVWVAVLMVGLAFISAVYSIGQPKANL